MTMKPTPSRKYSQRRLTKQSKDFFTPGEMARGIREARKMSIREVAKSIHSSSKVVSKIENGYIRDMSMKKFIDYLDAIGAMLVVVPYAPPAGADLRTQQVSVTVTGKNQTLSNFIRRDGEMDVSDDWEP